MYCIIIGEIPYICPFNKKEEIIKDTQREKAPSNKTQALMKSMNIGV